MRKGLIALLLCVVLAVSGPGTLSVFAGETGARETVKAGDEKDGKGNGTALSEKVVIRPGATTKVTLTNVASGIKISWNKVRGAKCYKVYRDKTYLFTTSRLYATDTGVKKKNGVKYTYRVVASRTKKDSSGDSLKDRKAIGMRLIPVGIKSLESTEPGSMTVTYDTNRASTGYVVRFGLESDMSDAKVITVKGAGTSSRTFTGLEPGKTYYVQVRTYKLENGTQYFYSGYCRTKEITIKGE